MDKLLLAGVAMAVVLNAPGADAEAAQTALQIATANCPAASRVKPMLGA